MQAERLFVYVCLSFASFFVCIAALASVKIRSALDHAHTVVRNYAFLGSVQEHSGMIAVILWSALALSRQRAFEFYCGTALHFFANLGSE